VNVDL
jgi:hypothetical protein